MSNDDRILKILEGMDKRLEDIEQGQDRTETALDALKAGQEDLQGKMATKADIAMLEEKIDATKIEVDQIKKRQRPHHAD